MLDAALRVVFLLATSIWVGGLVTIAVVAQAAHHTLGPADSLAFFRALGRFHGVLGTVALLIALITGALLLRHHSRDGPLLVAVLLAAALLATSVVGML